MAQKKTVNSKTKTKAKSSSSKTTKSAAEKKREAEARARNRAAIKAIEEEEKEKLKKKKIMKSEIISIVIISLGVFFVLSMLTNACGMVGIAVSKFLKGILGKVSYVLPFFMIILGVLVFAQKTALLTFRSLICSILLFVLLSAFVAGFLPPLKGLNEYAFQMKMSKDIYALGSTSGGIIGVAIGSLLLNLTGRAGLYIISSIGIIIMLLFIIDTPVSQLMDNWKLKREIRKHEAEEKYQQRIAEKEAELAEKEKQKEAEVKQLTIDDIDKNSQPAPLKQETKEKILKDTELPKLSVKPIADIADNHLSQKTVIPEYTIEFDKVEDTDTVYREYEGEDITENKRQILDYVADDNFLKQDVEEKEVDILEKYGSKTLSPSSDESKELTAQINEVVNSEEAKKVSSDYKFPPIDLLKKSANLRGSAKGHDMSDQAQLLEDTLQSFGVAASVVDVVKGPSVTRFEVQPAPGVQVSKIVHLQDDIALNLRAKSIRIEAPIPGKAAVGIEVSNDTASSVLLRELIDSKEFKHHKSKIAVTLGKSITGENIVCDIHEMPHLLIAGTTGSGKSVCLNSMLVSILYHAKPDEVKLILIDPKVVEMAPYNGIPHLMIPVVTEPAKASVALSWAVNEMNERYNKFAEEGVRDLKSYNEAVKFKGNADFVMPEVIIVIDELSDLIMAAKNSVEDSICRLAQKARAAGMHLIIATQTPRTDVLTGVIKANIPSRIALSVSSQIDSRVILDMGGAEHLLGKGDMLYSPQSLSKPIRIQGTFISDGELHDVIEFVKNQSLESGYNEEILSAMDKIGSNNMGSAEDDENDELFMDALETFVRAGSGSVSMLQRRFRIGYNRAARLVDMMEERGMVGPGDGQRGRKVLMTPEEFDEYRQRTDELEGNI